MVSAVRSGLSRWVLALVCASVGSLALPGAAQAAFEVTTGPRAVHWLFEGNNTLEGTVTTAYDGLLPDHIEASDCSDSIESLWKGEVLPAGRFGQPTELFSFTMPAVGATLTWAAPFSGIAPVAAAATSIVFEGRRDSANSVTFEEEVTVTGPAWSLFGTIKWAGAIVSRKACGQHGVIRFTRAEKDAFTAQANANKALDLKLVLDLGGCPEFLVGPFTGVWCVGVGTVAGLDYLTNTAVEEGLAEDPVDPDFRSLPSAKHLQFPHVNAVGRFSRRDAATVNTLVNDYSRSCALSEALETAINRAQGANLTEDPANEVWEARQMEAAARFAEQLAPLLERIRSESKTRIRCDTQHSP